MNSDHERSELTGELSETHKRLPSKKIEHSRTSHLPLVKISQTQVHTVPRLTSTNLHQPATEKCLSRCGPEMVFLFYSSALL